MAPAARKIISRARAALRGAYDEPDDVQEVGDETATHTGMMGETNGSEPADPMRVDVPCIGELH